MAETIEEWSFPYVTIAYQDYLNHLIIALIYPHYKYLMWPYQLSILLWDLQIELIIMLILFPLNKLYK